MSPTVTIRRFEFPVVGLPHKGMFHIPHPIVPGGDKSALCGRYSILWRSLGMVKGLYRSPRLCKLCRAAFQRRARMGESLP